jgi:NAD(P)-dependent dehydrogenase (short-subunit alcohol dehydrogenase family)
VSDIDLTGKVAVITGGGGAIGAESSAILARNGATVVVADIDQNRVDEVVAAINAAGGRALPFVGDVTDAATVDRLFEYASAELGGIDILINGVGEHLLSAGSHEDSEEETWQALYEVNLLHVFRACRLAVPIMRERGWGRIVNFSSVEGIRAAPALAVYAAFKAAVDAFTKSIAVDVARDGIRVNAIAVDKTRAYQVGHYELPEEYARLAHTWIPSGRYGEPEDVAGVVLFLSSELSSWVTGQTIVADGGTLSAGGWFRTPKRWTNQPLLVQYFDDDPDANEQRPPAVQ